MLHIQAHRDINDLMKMSQNGKIIPWYGIVYFLIKVVCSFYQSKKDYSNYKIELLRLYYW